MRVAITQHVEAQWKKYWSMSVSYLIFSSSFLRVRQYIAFIVRWFRRGLACDERCIPARVSREARGGITRWYLFVMLHCTINKYHSCTQYILLIVPFTCTSSSCTFSGRDENLKLLYQSSLIASLALSLARSCCTRYSRDTCLQTFYSIHTMMPCHCNYLVGALLVTLLAAGPVDAFHIAGKGASNIVDIAVNTP